MCERSCCIACGVTLIDVTVISVVQVVKSDFLL